MADESTVTQAVEDLHANGFAVIENVISEERLAKAERDAEGLMEQSSFEAPGIDQPVKARLCKGLFTKSRIFDDLYVNPTVLDVVDKVLANEDHPRAYNLWGGNLQLAGTMLKDNVPGESSRRIHQDDGLYPLPKSRQCVIINTLLALDPFTIETGATLVVPGSHLWEKPPEQDAECESVEMSPGSVLLLDGRIWHTNGINRTTNQNRKALNCYYCTRWLRPYSGQYLGMTNEEVQQLSEPLQAIMC